MPAGQEGKTRGGLRSGWLLWGLGGALLLAGLLWQGGCARPGDPWAGAPGEPRIVVTIPPLYSMTRAVAGERAAIVCLCTTTGPHHYELDYRDARLLGKADVFFAIGLTLDNRFSDGLPGLAQREPNLPALRYVKLGQRLRQRGLVLPMRKHAHQPGKNGNGKPHVHGEYDPHVWLGMEQAAGMVEIIRDELAALDPDHDREYRKNADAFLAELKKLHADGKELFATKKVKRIISFHDALEYFAKSFGLEIADVIETGPGDNPTPHHLARLVELCRDAKKPVGAITVEPQYPESMSAGKVQEELKRKGITVELVTVDPLETADAEELKAEGKAWYEARMRRNLKALADVLP